MIAKLRELETGDVIGALHHPEVGDIDLICGEPDSNPRKRFGLAEIVRWHSREGVLEDSQGIINSMRAERDNPQKWNDNTIQLENDTHIVVLCRNWEGTPRQLCVLTAYLDKLKAASSAGRTIDIPGTREQDWPSPPLGAATCRKDDRRFWRSHRWEGWNSFTQSGHFHYRLTIRSSQAPQAPAKALSENTSGPTHVSPHPSVPT